jgi:amino-acid N-acetyltransferase
VVGLTGEAIDAGKLSSIVQDLAMIQAMGVKIVLVHGFRPQVNEQLRLKGQEPRYYNGMRVTDSIALDCAQEAAGQLRYEIEAAFSQGLPNTPMAGARVRVISGNFLTARPVGIVDGVDFMHSGLVRKVDVEGIRSALDSEAMVLVALRLLAHGRGLQPQHGRSGHPRGHRAEGRQAAVPDRSARRAHGPQARPTRTTPSTPSCRWTPRAACWPSSPPHSSLPTWAFTCSTARACEHGVERSHILPFSTDGALLLEIYVHDGIGTMVIDEKLEELREATIDDVGGIIQLIEPFERDGTLVKRDRTEIERDIASYTVIEHDGVIFGCAALHPIGSQDGGDGGATVAQEPGHGRRRPAAQTHRTARPRLGLDSIFVLTTRTMHWFIKRGFQPVDPNGCPRPQAPSTTGTAEPGAGEEALS